jgi:hypothetical protein
MKLKEFLEMGGFNVILISVIQANQSPSKLYVHCEWSEAIPKLQVDCFILKI